MSPGRARALARRPTAHEGRAVAEAREGGRRQVRWEGRVRTPSGVAVLSLLFGALRRSVQAVPGEGGRATPGRPRATWGGACLCREICATSETPAGGRPAPSLAASSSGRSTRKGEAGAQGGNVSFLDEEADPRRDLGLGSLQPPHGPVCTKRFLEKGVSTH